MKSKLQKAIETAAMRVCNTSRPQYGSLWDAYQIALDLLSTLAEQGAVEHDKLSESASKRLSLTANLLHSTAIIEHIISSGYYLAAAAVLRQYMETLVRIREIREGKPITGKKPPDISILPVNLRRNYGRLSELCHTTNGELLVCFAENPESEWIAKITPHYREEWAKGFFSLHIAHMMILAGEIDALHREIYTQKVLADLEKSINMVAYLLVDADFLKF